MCHENPALNETEFKMYYFLEIFSSLCTLYLHFALETLHSTMAEKRHFTRYSNNRRKYT